MSGATMERATIRTAMKDGNFNSAGLMGTTSRQFGVNRHTESAVNRDSDSISFSQDYETPPKITFTPQSAITQSSNLGATQRIDLRAQNLTVSGFDLKAVVKSTTGQSSTGVTDGFSSTQNTSAPENGDVTLSADGDVAYSNLEDANATETTYEAYFDVSVPASSGFGSDSATVLLEANDGSTSTTFDTKDAKVYGDGTSLSDERLSFTGSLGTGWDLRLRLTTNSNNVSVTAHGEDNAEPGVQFSKVSGSPATESATPEATDGVLWEAKDTA